MDKLLVKLLSLFLAVSILIGDIGPSFAQSDKLAASLLNDTDLNPARSKALNLEAGKLFKPGTIGIGTFYESFLTCEGMLPDMPRISLSRSKYAQDIVEKIQFAAELGIKECLTKRSSVPPECVKRFDLALKGMISLYTHPEERLYLFPAIVNSEEDYFFGFTYCGRIGLASGLVDRLYKTDPMVLAYYVFYECLAESKRIEDANLSGNAKNIINAIFPAKMSKVFRDEAMLLIESARAPENFSSGDYCDLLREAERYAAQHRLADAYRYYCFASVVGERLKLDTTDLDSLIWRLTLNIVENRAISSKNDKRIRSQKLEGLAFCIEFAAANGAWNVSDMLINNGNKLYRDDPAAQKKIKTAAAKAKKITPETAHPEIEFDTVDDEPLRALFHMKSRFAFFRMNEDLVRISRIYNDMGKKEEAVNVFVRNQSAESVFLDMATDISSIYEELGMFDNALTLIDHVIDNSEEMFSALAKEDESVLGDPVRDFFSRIYFQRASILYKMRLYKAALSDLEDAYGTKRINHDMEVLKIASLLGVYSERLKRPANLRRFINSYYFNKFNSARAAFLTGVKMSGNVLAAEIMKRIAFSEIYPVYQQKGKRYTKEKRLLAIDALGHIGNGHSAWALLRLLQKSKDKDVKRHAENALIKLGEKSLYNLNRLIKYEDERDGHRAAIIKRILRAIRENMSNALTGAAVTSKMAPSGLVQISLKHSTFKIELLISALRELAKDLKGNKLILALDLDTVGTDEAQLMPLFAMLDKLGDIPDGEGKPLRESMVFLKAHGKDIFNKIRAETSDYKNVFLVGNPENEGNGYYAELNDKNGWTAILHDGEAKVYEPIYEGFLLMLLAKAGANLHVIKDLYNEVTSMNVTDEGLEAAIDSKTFHIFPRAQVLEHENLRKYYERLKNYVENQA